MSGSEGRKTFEDFPSRTDLRELGPSGHVAVQMCNSNSVPVAIRGFTNLALVGEDLILSKGRLGNPLPSFP
jgi:hypothetical protein